jgi:hypothetical protein
LTPCASGGDAELAVAERHLRVGREPPTEKGDKFSLIVEQYMRRASGIHAS